MTKARRIAILSGGGDCPGINAVIRAVAKPAILHHGIEVLGVEDGFQGLIEDRLRPLTDEDVSGILAVGASTYADDPDNCLLCHQFRGLGRIDPQTQKLHAYSVDPDFTHRRLGPHARLSCTQCHEKSEVAVVPHKPVTRVDCARQCHLSNPNGIERRFSHESVQRMLDAVINTAAPGETADDLLEDVEWRSLRFRPDVVVLMLGIDDATAGPDNCDQFRDRVLRLVECIRSDGGLPVLHTAGFDFYQIDLEDRVNAISTQNVSTDPTAGAAYDNYLALVGAGVVGAQLQCSQPSQTSTMSQLQVSRADMQAPRLQLMTGADQDLDALTRLLAYS